MDNIANNLVSYSNIQTRTLKYNTVKKTETENPFKQTFEETLIKRITKDIDNRKLKEERELRFTAIKC